MKYHTLAIAAILASNITPLAAAPTTVWLSDLDLAQVRQSLGQAHKDKSMEGKPLAIGGKAYERGIGMHSEATSNYRCIPARRSSLPP